MFEAWAEGTRHRTAAGIHAATIGANHESISFEGEILKSTQKDRWLRAVCAALFLAAAGTAQAQTYKLNLPLEDDPDTVLQTITVDAKATRVTLLMKNTTDDDIEVCANQSGSPEAFSLKVLDTGEVLQQTAVSGASDCKVKMDTVRPGKQKTLRLSFPPLPKGATRLQLGEKDCQRNLDPQLENWCFREIVLTAR